MACAASKNIKKSIYIIITTVLIFDNRFFLYTTSVKTHKRLRDKGYEVEIHLVDTEDGYTLALERVPHPKYNTTVGDPVLLVHGLFSNSLVFVLNYTSLATTPYSCPTGRKKMKICDEENHNLHPAVGHLNTAFSLIDEGYDVWMYNSRGAGLTREMANEHLDELSWKYSFHEMGVYDLVACVNYITNIRKKSITIIGYSLGGTITLILLSERAEFNKKISKSILIAPAVRMKNAKSPLDTLRFWSPFIMEFLDVFEFFPYTMNPDSTLKSIRKYCEGSKRTLNNCRLFLNFVNGVESKMADEAVLNFLSSFPQPVSSRTLKHYMQSLVTGDFRKYDYGSKINLMKYNNTIPPQYNLTKITSPVIIICSLTDPVVTVKDTKWLVSRLSNVIEVNSIKNVQFGHLSYIADAHSKELVGDYILQKLNTDQRMVNNLR